MTQRKIRETVIALGKKNKKKNVFHHENIAYKKRPYLNEHCMRLHYMAAVLPIARELRSGFRPTNHGETCLIGHQKPVCQKQRLSKTDLFFVLGPLPESSLQFKTIN